MSKLSPHIVEGTVLACTRAVAAVAHRGLLVLPQLRALLKYIA